MTLLKSNNSSNDNTLAFPYFNPKNDTYSVPPPPPKVQSTIIPEFNRIMNPSFASGSVPNFNSNGNHMNSYEPRSNSNNLTNFSEQAISGKHNSANNDLRNSIDFFTKQSYKQDLDKQVAANHSNRTTMAAASKEHEISLLQQYPFGQRTDPNSYINHNNNQQNSYQAMNNPNGHPIDYRAPVHLIDQTHRYDKNNIVEKPNSLMNDLPSYDPIKHRNGNNHGYSYDPWGKPGGGAPLVDRDTGKKSTKISGQVWYDTIGVFPDERAKHYVEKQRILPIEEQKQLMLAEQHRKRLEIENLKKPSLDVSSWISGYESHPSRNVNNTANAHLPHTSVVREKIDVEAARRYATNPTEANKYFNELAQQEEERNRHTKLQKLKEDVAGIEHTRKWDQLWGKPGAGNKNGPERRRAVIGTLESPRFGDYQKEYGGKSLSLSDSYQTEEKNSRTGNLLYAKTIKHSNHTNLYDNEPSQMKVNS